MRNAAKGAAASDANDTGSDRTAIAAVLVEYNAALTASSAEGCLALYVGDGIFTPPFRRSAVGKAAVRKAYQKVFDTITLPVKFTVEEIVQRSLTWRSCAPTRQERTRSMRQSQ